MKWFAVGLIVSSLVLGLISASTAYLPEVDAIAPEDHLTLNAPAGQDPDEPRSPLLQPVEDEPVVLTAERLQTLREAGVHRVTVKEFAWQRWTHRWWFVLSATGLFMGGLMVRIARRQELLATLAQQQHTGAAPEQLLPAACEAIQQLRSDLSAKSDRVHQLRTVIERINAIQAEQLDPFVAAGPTLVGRLGMTGYAQLMDRFSAAERQLNRAWSAAADGVLEESLVSLDAAAAAADEAAARLRQLDAAGAAAAPPS